ncbi:MAG TPA: Gmad2 immunoglobulin-like domain-containing protein [Acidimicrobiales bacterium]|nr:Gmad2 immunoglobulin-like domain-containing protein [Acidimicrobiales bacterium]
MNSLSLSSTPTRRRAAQVGAVALLGLALGACSSGTPAAHRSTTGSTSTTSTTVGITAQSTTSTTAGAGSGPSTTSTTNPPETPAAGSPITVASPATGATVGSPLTVSGTSKLGSQAIEVQLTDGAGNMLCQAVAHPGSGGVFSVTLRFAVSQPGPGSLALFEAASGSARSDLSQVPVQLSD